jgi:hypothetical protein
MKPSAVIYAALQTTLAKIRELNAEAERRCQPIQRSWKLSDAENDENFRRASRLDQIIAECGKANTDESKLRKEYANALEAERAPPPAAPSEALAALYRQWHGAKQRIESLRAARSENALAGAEGDKRAKATLAKAVQDHEAAETELENLELAIKQAEARDAEVLFEFFSRVADEKHRAGVVAADDLVAWAEKFDNLLSYVAAHYAKLPELQRALAKSGADINTDLTNRLYPKASRDRAAKAAGLHHVFSIDAAVQAASLGDAFKSLMRAAVRRPEVKRKAAA